jgi:hypothetical protein
MDDDKLADRVMALEAKVRDLEDRAAIGQLIAAYGPAVDSNRGEAVRALFSEDGTYELEGWFFTHETMSETVTTDLHRRYVAAGSAHVMSGPLVTIDGDRATAINYSFVLIAEGGRFVIDRTAANRWDLRRDDGRWRVRRRVNRLTNGSEAARSLLAGEIPPPPA